MKTSVTISLALFLAATCIPGAQEPAPPGQRIDLGGATLFVPHGYKPLDDVVNLVVHLHGAPRVIEPALVETGWPAVLVEFNRQGLSRVYSEPFSEAKLFPSLIDRALKALHEEGIATNPVAGKVVVSSFSAGFGGVREILKVPAHFERIDALVMADSLYAGYTGEPRERRIDPNLLSGFTRFARAAAEGKKTLLLTHSAQVPDGYASTTETADALIKAVGGEATPANVDWGNGWTQVRRYSKGRLLVLGFAGTAGDDHLKHLRAIGKIWKSMPDPFAK
jgi:hypothetical protein